MPGLQARQGFAQRVHGTSGSGEAATAEGGRAAGQELSQTNAGIQGEDAALKAKQQGQAESELGNLYGTDVSAGNNALGLANNAIDIAGNQKPGFWQNLGQMFGVDVMNGAEAGDGGILMDPSTDYLDPQEAIRQAALAWKPRNLSLPRT